MAAGPDRLSITGPEIRPRQDIASDRPASCPCAAQNEAAGSKRFRLARFCDHLSSLDRLATLDLDFACIRVSGDETVGMADEDQIAIAFELVACIGDDAALGRFDRGALGQGYVDPIIATGPEGLNDASARGPAEFGLNLGRSG